MFNPLDNVPLSVTQTAVCSNLSQEEENRRTDMALNRDFFYGKGAESLTLVNEDQDPHTINLVKPIIRKRSSLLYNKKLVREFDGPPASISYIENVYQDNSIDELLLQVDLNAELTGSCLVTPVEDEDMEYGVRLRIYDASSFTPLGKEDDLSKLDALSIVRVIDRLNPKNDRVERIVKQQIWTEENIANYEGQTVVASESNNLGFIPFANFKGEEVYDQYLGHAPGRDVRLLNESINLILSDLAFGIKFQGFPPIAVSGWSGDTMVSIHPGRALNLPSGANAAALGLNPKIKEIHEFLMWLEEKCYELNSVPKISVVGGGEAKSGVELMIRWFPLVTLFNEKAVRYQRYELQLANTILKWAGLEPIKYLKTHFDSSNVLPVTEETDRFEKDIEFSIKTPIDEVMRRDPDLTEDEAQAIVMANADINEQLGLTASAKEVLTNDFMPGRDGRVPGVLGRVFKEEDHPRDEHGKFTKKEIDEITNLLKKVLPKESFDTPEMPGAIELFKTALKLF